MKLYYAQTANCYKTCAVAKHLQLPVEFIHVDLGQLEHKTPDFLSKNPNGKVPVLETDNGTLWESTAIMCHFARQAKSDLWPEDERQVDVMRWLSWDMDNFLPTAGVYYFENIIKPQFGLGEPDQDAIKSADKDFYQHAKILEDHLEAQEFLVGDSLTLADLSVAVLLPYADKAQIPLNGFSNIQRWHDNLMQLPAWQAPFPTT
ncbi:glutathione S-transferase family protein [Kangiella shandongensis]|uniref:glutathione S-transferase family protein n=1 Tax=Kangiella shandongensis TaxID=2763258 RepID=UPI001CC069F0|nr:glutathione S-transferase family protein [Kangiella shandongensis]